MKFVLSRLTPLALLLSLQMGAQAGVLEAHPGLWMGELKIPDGRMLKSGIAIFKRADGSPWASFSSPDQGAYDLPVVGIREEGDSATLDLGFGQMTLTWVVDHFVGAWQQGGATLRIDRLSSVAAFPKKSRPQTPVAPLPYQEETLAIRSADGVTLGATLSVPRDSAHFNVVILVHGSGPQTRDEENSGHATFAVLADYLVRQGIAVLRYDKRGVSRSTGDYAKHTQPQLAEDLFAVVEAVKARKQFDRVGVVGHSEGPMIAAAVLAKHPRAFDFLVSLAGVGLPGKTMLELQDRLLIVDRGASPAETERLMRYVSRFYDIVIAEPDPERRIAALRAQYARLSDEDRDLLKKYKLGRGTLSIAGAGQPALPVLLKGNVDRDWRAVKVPVLALNGSVDHQVPPPSLAGLVASLEAGGNRQVESAVLPSINHALQTATTGAESEYGAIDETVAPVVLEKVAAFVKRQR